MAGFDMEGYVDVAERLKLFYERYPNGRLKSGGAPYMVEAAGKAFVVYHAQAFREPDDPLPADGWAWEPVPGPTQFTKDSELMNAETAAWGRAIVACGFETKKVASRNEVENRRQDEGGQPYTGAGAPAGGSSGQRVFDVARDLLPGAIKVTDEQTMEQLRSALAFLDPTVEPRVWQTIEDQAREHVFGDGEMTPGQWGQHWRRLANLVRAAQVKAAEYGHDFPEREIIVKAAAYAYEGFSTPLLAPVGETPAQAPEDAQGGAQERTDTSGEAPDA